MTTGTAVKIDLDLMVQFVKIVSENFCPLLTLRCFLDLGRIVYNNLAVLDDLLDLLSKFYLWFPVEVLYFLSDSAMNVWPKRLGQMISLYNTIETLVWHIKFTTFSLFVVHIIVLPLALSETCSCHSLQNTQFVWYCNIMTYQEQLHIDFGVS